MDIANEEYVGDFDDDEYDDETPNEDQFDSNKYSYEFQLKSLPAQSIDTWDRRKSKVMRSLKQAKMNKMISKEPKKTMSYSESVSEAQELEKEEEETEDVEEIAEVENPSFYKNYKFQPPEVKNHERYSMICRRVESNVKKDADGGNGLGAVSENNDISDDIEAPPSLSLADLESITQKIASLMQDTLSSTQRIASHLHSLDNFLETPAPTNESANQHSHRKSPEKLKLNLSRNNSASRGAQSNIKSPRSSLSKIREASAERLSSSPIVQRSSPPKSPPKTSPSKKSHNIASPEVETSRSSPGMRAGLSTSPSSPPNYLKATKSSQGRSIHRKTGNLDNPESIEFSTISQDSATKFRGEWESVGRVAYGSVHDMSFLQNKKQTLKKVISENKSYKIHNELERMLTGEQENSVTTETSLPEIVPGVIGATSSTAEWNSNSRDGTLLETVNTPNHINKARPQSKRDMIEKCYKSQEVLHSIEQELQHLLQPQQYHTQHTHQHQHSHQQHSQHSQHQHSQQLTIQQHSNNQQPGTPVKRASSKQSNSKENSPNKIPSRPLNNKASITSPIAKFRKPKSSASQEV